MNDEIKLGNPDAKAAAALWDQPDEEESSDSNKVTVDIAKALGAEGSDAEIKSMVDSANDEANPTQSLMDAIAG